MLSLLIATRRILTSDDTFSSKCYFEIVPFFLQNYRLAKTFAARIMNNVRWSETFQHALVCLVSRIWAAILPSMVRDHLRDTLQWTLTNADKRDNLFAVPCNEEDNCSPYGLCSYDGNRKKHVCICMPGYVGEWNARIRLSNVDNLL